MNCLYIFRGVGSSLSSPNFSNSPIWMFGNQYKPPDNNNIVLNGNTDNNNNNNNTNSNTNTSNSPQNHLLSPIISSSNQQQAEFITEFLDDFSNRVLWFTYRQGFPNIDNSIYDNDCGWGCMLRSGQMLLSNVLLHNSLKKEIWRKSNLENASEIFTSVVRKFLDRPSSPFSIHNIALEGQKLGKQIGEWFAPTIISQAIKELVTKNNNQCNIEVFISEDGSLYIDQLENISKNKQTNNNSTENIEDIIYGDEEWKPLLILIPMRLGLETLNNIYYQSLLEIFKIPQNLGIVGGKPRASLYFIASQDENLFYLDPHTVQNALPSNISENDNIPLNTYFCSTPKKIHISEVDPSLVIAFFCKNKNDLNDFIERSKQMISQLENPIFSISNNAPDYKYQKDFTLSDNEDDDENCTYTDDESDKVIESNETNVNNNNNNNNINNNKDDLENKLHISDDSINASGEESDEIDIETDYHLM